MVFTLSGIVNVPVNSVQLPNAQLPICVTPELSVRLFMELCKECHGMAALLAKFVIAPVPDIVRLPVAVVNFHVRLPPHVPFESA
jgi:hypothetical protein